MRTEYEKFYNNIDDSGPMQFLRREVGRKLYGFAVLTTEAIRLLKPHAPFIEIGSGSGYWAYEMKKQGVKIVATDLVKLNNNIYKFSKKWTSVKWMTAKQAIKKYPDHTLLIVWPCYDKPWAYEALKTYKGNTLVYCGEGYGGCTANDKFHELLEREWEQHTSIGLPRWFGLHDYLDVYIRKTHG